MKTACDGKQCQISLAGEYNFRRSMESDFVKHMRKKRAKEKEIQTKRFRKEVNKVIGSRKTIDRVWNKNETPDY